SPASGQQAAAGNSSTDGVRRAIGKDQQWKAVNNRHYLVRPILILHSTWESTIVWGPGKNRCLFCLRLFDFMHGAYTFEVLLLSRFAVGSVAQRTEGAFRL
ncbi:unnamed protein product, partial [Phaeothamnion confervicola]